MASVVTTAERLVMSFVRFPTLEEAKAFAGGFLAGAGAYGGDGAGAYVEGSAELEELKTEDPNLHQQILAVFASGRPA